MEKLFFREIIIKINIQSLLNFLTRKSVCEIPIIINKDASYIFLNIIV